MEDFNDSIVVEMHGNEEVAFVIRMVVKTTVKNEARYYLHEKIPTCHTREFGF